MKRHIIYLSLAFVILISWKINAESVKLLEDLPPYSIAVYCSKSAKDFDVKIAAFNQYGQVMLLGYASSTKGLGFMKIGERMTSGTAAKILNLGQGQVSFNFIKSTAGSSLVIGGEDGNVRDFEELPKGFHRAVNQPGYLLIGTVQKLTDLPLKASILAEWADQNKIAELIASKKIQFLPSDKTGVLHKN